MNLKHITKKVVSQNYKFNDTVEKALFKMFRRVTKDTILGLVSRILEIDEFVVVVDENDRPISIITNFDLLSFIADDSKAANTVIGGAVTKGVSNVSIATNGTNGVHANEHSNGQTH